MKRPRGTGAPELGIIPVLKGISAYALCAKDREFTEMADKNSIVQMGTAAQKECVIHT